MDKRTLFFVLALTLVLFGVNMYFENQNQDKLRLWNQQQASKRKETVDTLEKNIQDHTAKIKDLPIVQIFLDENANTNFGEGYLFENKLITTTPNPPATVYAKQNEQLTKFSLQKGMAAIFSSDENDEPLKVQQLPAKGQMEIQLLSLDQPITIHLAEINDGKITYTEDEINRLKALINGQEPPKVPTRSGTALVLVKTLKGFQPVATYDNKTRIVTPLSKETALAITSVTGAKGEEKYYVIENNYQQLVFSNYGGALVEINLPFRSKTNQQSVVKEIEFDRDMVKEHPYNAYFPAHPYYTAGDKEAHPQGKLGGYYPLIRRDLIETGDRKSVHIPPQYYSLNIVSEYPEVAEQVYEVKEFSNNKIVFESNQPHRRITKTYSVENELKDAPYTINLTVNVEGDSRGLWITTGVPEVEWISGGPAPALKYRITRNGKPEVVMLDNPAETLNVSSLYPDWVCNSNGFFGLILDPLTKIDAGFKVQNVSGKVVPSRLVEIDEQYDRFSAEAMPGYMMLMPLNANGGQMDFRIVAGPFAESVLKTVDQVYSNPETGYNPDYIGSQTFHGWFAFISEPFAKFLFILMKFFYFITGSWGFSIILLTVALRVMLYPLNAWSSKSMIKMQQIAPDVTAIQEKYKKDPKKAQLEVMNLYRDRGVNPVSGCLPLLIQMPFLIGMFDLLKSTFELRGASFVPGWIDDLSAPDVLFSWATPIPFIGNQFHLLPILLGAVMFLQQRFTSTGPKDPNLMTDQQRQQRSMGTMMAVLFCVMFYNFPSGLNIYWLSSMLLGMLQQWWTMKRMAATPVQAVAKRAKK